MDNDLKKLCKEVEGRIVTLGLEEKYVKFLEKNKQITTLDAFDIVSKKKKIKGKFKNISINKIRKYFKKKKIDAIFYQTDQMENHLFHLPKEIIYIGKKDLYLIGKKESILKTIPKFERYTPYKEKKEYKDKILVHFTLDCVTSNKIKDFLYFITDNFISLFELLQDYLTN